MSRPQPPSPARLVIGLFSADKHLFPKIAADLIKTYGAIQIISTWFSFDYTTYYEKEMGGPLFRRLLVFQQPVRQGDLAAIKLHTNQIETRYEASRKRMVNIDPGYLLLERFVLATGKNYTHRIYVGKGIYADLTLIYQNGSYQPLPWTYPDYADPSLLAFLNKVRNRFRIDSLHVPGSSSNQNNSTPNR